MRRLSQQAVAPTSNFNVIEGPFGADDALKVRENGRRGRMATFAAQKIVGSGKHRERRWEAAIWPGSKYIWRGGVADDVILAPEAHSFNIFFHRALHYSPWRRAEIVACGALLEETLTR